MSMKIPIVLSFLLASIPFSIVGRHFIAIRSMRQEFDDYQCGKIEKLWVRIAYGNMGRFPKLWEFYFELIGDKWVTFFFNKGGYFFIVFHILCIITAVFFAFLLPSDIPL